MSRSEWETIEAALSLLDGRDVDPMEAHEAWLDGGQALSILRTKMGEATNAKNEWRKRAEAAAALGREFKARIEELERERDEAYASAQADFDEASLAIAERDTLRRTVEGYREALERIIAYVPPGFISPMDDEDSMNYRHIARQALEHSANEEGT